MAEVGNGGYGGADDEYWLDKEAEKKVQARFAELPEYDLFSDNPDRELLVRPNLETWCAEQVNDWLVVKDAKKLLKKVATYRSSENAIYTWSSKVKPTPDNIQQLREIGSFKEDDVVLNELPIDEVVGYLRAAS